MFLNLQKYLGSNEKIIYRFGIGMQFVIVSMILWTLFLGGLSWLIRYLGGDVFISRFPLVILIVISFYYILTYLSMAYFVTNKKIYKRFGIGFSKVISAKHSEIDDMIVTQSFFEKIFFNTGTLKFNTPGSAGFEIIMLRVGNPYNVKTEIFKSWE